MLTLIYKDKGVKKEVQLDNMRQLGEFVYINQSITIVAVRIEGKTDANT